MTIHGSVHDAKSNKAASSSSENVTSNNLLSPPKRHGQVGYMSLSIGTYNQDIDWSQVWLGVLSISVAFEYSIEHRQEISQEIYGLCSNIIPSVGRKFMVCVCGQF